MHRSTQEPPSSSSFCLQSANEMSAMRVLYDPTDATCREQAVGGFQGSGGALKTSKFRRCDEATRFLTAGIEQSDCERVPGVPFASGSVSARALTVAARSEESEA